LCDFIKLHDQLYYFYNNLKAPYNAVLMGNRSSA
jgi:hypothetical protein